MVKQFGADSNMQVMSAAPPLDRAHEKILDTK